MELAGSLHFNLTHWNRSSLSQQRFLKFVPLLQQFNYTFPMENPLQIELMKAITNPRTALITCLIDGLIRRQVNTQWTSEIK